MSAAQVSSASLPSAPAPGPQVPDQDAGAPPPLGNVTLSYQPSTDLSVGGYPMGGAPGEAAPVQAPAPGAALPVAPAPAESGLMNGLRHSHASEAAPAPGPAPGASLLAPAPAPLQATAPTPGKVSGAALVPAPITGMVSLLY